MPAKPATRIAIGNGTRRESPPQPSKRPRTLSAQASAGAGAGRWRSSASSRAARRRAATPASRRNPWFSTWRTLFPNCGSFIMARSGLCRSPKRDAPRLQCARQSMRRPRAVRLHASLGATHGLGGLGNVQFLPVTHDKSFTLTWGQLCNLFLNYFKYLGPFYLDRRGLLGF